MVEIMEVKYRKKARKLEEIYMKANTYVNVAQRVSLINNNNNQPDQYKALNEKLMQLRPNN